MRTAIATPKAKVKLSLEETVAAADRMAAFIRGNETKAVVASGGNVGYATYLLRKVMAARHPDYNPLFIGMGFMTEAPGERLPLKGLSNWRTCERSPSSLRALYDGRLRPLLKKEMLSHSDRIFIFEEFNSSGKSLERAHDLLRSLGFTNLKIGSLVIGIHRGYGKWNSTWLANIQPDFIGEITLDEGPALCRYRARRGVMSGFMSARAVGGQHGDYLKKQSLWESRFIREKIDGALKAHLNLMGHKQTLLPLREPRKGNISGRALAL